jgi:hypothetical protein
MVEQFYTNDSVFFEVTEIVFNLPYTPKETTVKVRIGDLLFTDSRGPNNGYLYNEDDKDKECEGCIEGCEMSPKCFDLPVGYVDYLNSQVTIYLSPEVKRQMEFGINVDYEFDNSSYLRIDKEKAGRPWEV